MWDIFIYIIPGILIMILQVLCWTHGSNFEFSISCLFASFVAVHGKSRYVIDAIPFNDDGLYTPKFYVEDKKKMF